MKYELARCDLQNGVERRRNALVLLRTINEVMKVSATFRRHRCDGRTGVIGRAIIDDDQLYRRIGLLEGACKASAYKSFMIVSGCNDGHERLRSHPQAPREATASTTQL